MRSFRRAVPAVLLFLVVNGCGGGADGPTTTPPPPPPPPTPANLSKEAGDNQTGEPGLAVAVQPKVKVTSSSGAPISGVTVTFAVATGAGSVTGATPATGSDGIATLGSWTLGAAPGSNTLTASIVASGVSGNPASFSATAQFPAFNPTGNTSLTGTRDFTSLNIPAGVTVTVTGPLLIRVSGNATIAGTLSGNCTSIEIRVTGNLTVDGLLQNTCTAPPADPPGIKLLADGDLIVGTTVSNQDAIVSDGSIRLTDTPTENIDLSPLVVFSKASELLGTGTTLRAPMGPVHAAKAGRPMKAGRGKDVTNTRDGPIEIAGALVAGNGADQGTLTQAGACTNALAIGGTGGRIQLVARNSTLTFKAGSSAKSGDGGKGGSCNSPSGCPSTAVGGKGGTGGSILLGASVIVFEANVKLIRGNGGVGGTAESNADDGAAPCANGCTATSTGGEGGNVGGIGYAVLSPGTVTGTPTEEGGNGGTGGTAQANGGDGRDCNICPAGKGGDGGSGTANGGRGGNGATGNIWPVAGGTHLKGNGGNALALGGNGGKGATCCTPLAPAGNGGNGGTATSIGGQIGAAGFGAGTRGVDAGFPGDGGAGGNGDPAGAGGLPGPGIGDPDDFPDGEPGPPGGPCPAFALLVTPPTQSVAVGAQVSLLATITRLNGFVAAVALQVKNAVNAVIASGTIAAGATSTNIQFTNNQTPGTQTLTVEGTGPPASPVSTEVQLVTTPAGGSPALAITNITTGSTATAGSATTFAVTVARTNFTGSAFVSIQNETGFVMGQFTIAGPAGTSGSGSYTPPVTSFTGAHNYRVNVQGSGVTTVMQDVPVGIIPPATVNVDLSAMPRNGNLVTFGTHVLPLRVDATQVGTVQVQTVFIMGNHFWSNSMPTGERVGSGDGNGFRTLFNTAQVNGAAYTVDAFGYCLLNPTGVDAGHPVTKNQRNLGGTVVNTETLSSVVSPLCRWSTIVPTATSLEILAPVGPGRFIDSGSWQIWRMPMP